jgi:membrane protein DedA with SNARE-associated domain/rhodanese-related sulfurtransferase
MPDIRQFLVQHGAPILFGAVFVEQIGFPLPALPWLLAAGALAAGGGINYFSALAVSTVACLVADTIWFNLGRRRGAQVLGWLCRISLEPDSCVRRTQNLFTRYGWRGILVAKFVPGLSTVAPPLAGMSRFGAAKFLFVDTAGSLLYGGVFLCLGFFFSSQIQKIEAAAAGVGGNALLVLGIALAAYIGFKFWQRHRLLNELRMARITVEELRKMLGAPENVVILDLRSIEELQHDPAIIQGAIHLTLDDINGGRFQIPHDREIVLYCSCPNEVTSARVAIQLRRKGFTRVRPLLGGIDAWRGQNLPMGRSAATKTAPRPVSA